MIEFEDGLEARLTEVDDKIDLTVGERLDIVEQRVDYIWNLASNGK